MYKLLYKGSGKTIWLIGNAIKLGRAKTSDVVINGSSVAEHHASIFIEGETLTLSPIAGCPVTINDKPILSNTVFSPGDVITVAGVAVELLVPMDEVMSDRSGGKSSYKPDSDKCWKLVGATRKEYDIYGTMIIGRSPECDITFSYERMSRKHAQFHEAEGVLWMTDLESANGTFINGKKLTGVARLEDGDEVAFEKFKFSIKAPEMSIRDIIEAEDDSSKTVVGSAISSEAVKKAQADLLEKQRRKELAQRQEQMRTAVEDKPPVSVVSKSSSGTLTIIIGIVVVLVISVAAYVLL